MSHAAIVFGKDLAILGIVSNNDQVLNMARLEKMNLGIMLRHWSLTEKTLLSSVEQFLSESKFRDAFKEAKKDFAKFDVDVRLRSLIETNL